MRNRITEKMLENLVSEINHLTGSPATPYTRDSNGNLRGNIGNYHLSHAYGGVNLHRMSNESGGINCPISHGYKTKRELFDLLHSFIRGIEINQRG